MSSVTADRVVRESLSGITGLAELCDEDGRVFGYYIPASRKDAELYARAAAAFDVEELRRRKASDGPVYTTAEVIEYVRQQEKP